VCREAGRSSRPDVVRQQAQEALMEWYLWLISLAIQITIAVVCYRIAEGKGRSGVLWGVIGFLFTIIGLIVILVLPDKSRSV
jgi:hypothetical protein